MPSIAVKDFGPIAQAEIDLKPLTVLIGPNNTGKSYLALAVYSLSQTVSATRYPRYGQIRSRGSAIPYGVRRSSVQRLKRAGDWNRIISDAGKFISGQSGLSRFPEKVRAWLRAESRPWAKSLTEGMKYELRRCFGSSMSQLGRRGYRSERHGFAIDVRDEATGLSWVMNCNEDDLSTDRWEPDMSVSLERRVRRPPFPSIMLARDESFAANMLSASYATFILQGFSSPSHYLPASRSGILQGHKTLASLIVGRASTAWIESMEVERLPGVITDLVQALLVLDRASPPSGKVKKIVEYLESNVVVGSVDIKKQLEYPELKYQNDAGEFRLHQVSSMISEIAPMVLYLKYLVRPGHLFIVEEPESHLDPANQRLVARAIAMLVNAGVRILVTTHSDIFLQQINNLVQASGLESRKRLRMGYKAVEVLNPGDVSAYVFHPGDDGTRVDALPVDSDYGISTESFDNVHSALYDEVIKMEHSG